MAEKSEPLKVEGLDLQQKDGLAFLSEIPDDSVDLILTDPPYIISRETGMNSHYQEVKKQEDVVLDKNNDVKTLQEQVKSLVRFQ